MNIKILSAPIHRESSSLAYSSRNQYLTPEQKKIAPKLHNTLVAMADKIKSGMHNYRQLEQQSAATLLNQGFKIDYISICNQDNLQLANHNANDNLIIIAGRYEGVDQRFIDIEVDEEWSIGDYILSGGEVAACVLIDAIARMIPGVLGHADSNKDESFSNGYLEHPHYTRPEVVESMSVPEVLLSGNHEEIRKWREKQAILTTNNKRSDLIKKKLS
jgi:tRNA (guanine37-N1)-methyltransferase